MNIHILTTLKQINYNAKTKKKSLNIFLRINVSFSTTTKKTQEIEKWCSEPIRQRISAALTKNREKNINFPNLCAEDSLNVDSFLKGGRPKRKVLFQKLFFIVDMGKTTIDLFVSIKDFSEGIFDIKSKKFRKYLKTQSLEQSVYTELADTKLGQKFKKSLKDRDYTDFLVKMTATWGERFGIWYHGSYTFSKNLYEDKINCEFISYINNRSEIMVGYNPKTARRSEIKELVDWYKILKKITVTSGDCCRHLEGLYKTGIYSFIKEAHIIAKANGFEPSSFKVEAITRISELSGKELKFFMNLLEYPGYYKGVLPEGIEFTANEIQNYLFTLQTLDENFLTICSHWHINQEVTNFTVHYLEHAAMLTQVARATGVVCW